MKVVKASPSWKQRILHLESPHTPPIVRFKLKGLVPPRITFSTHSQFHGIDAHRVPSISGLSIATEMHLRCFTPDDSSFSFSLFLFEMEPLCKASVCFPSLSTASIRRTQTAYRAYVCIRFCNAVDTATWSN